MTRPDGLEFKTLAVANPAEPDTHGVIEALVAVTGVKDEVNDYIEPGAFRRTLSDRPKPKVCLGHDWNRPIGKTLEIRELLPGDRRLPKETADGRPWPRTAGALWARFQVNLDSDDGRSAFSAAKFYGPEQSTYSIGYRTARAKQRGSTRHIQDLDLFEYGPVLNPANRLATLQSIKSDQELTNPVDSERQDFETGDGAVEAKTKYVRDATYWGKPLGTPITPGMKPRGGNDREHGTSEKPERTGSFFSSLPSDEQDFARSLPTDQRIKYLDARAAGKDHDEAAREARPQSAPKKPESPPVRAETDKPRETAPAAESKPATKPKKPAGPKKPTAKQKALLFDARPGRVMTWRRDDNGRRIYNAPFPTKEGLIFQGHANSAFPMEKAGWVEAGTDGRHYILTPQGERLRAQLESEDSDRQARLREERRAAALGPVTVQVADANVDANAAPMNMTPREYADGQMAAQARRKRAVNIAAEQAAAATEADFAKAADQAATLAPGAIDVATLLSKLPTRPYSQRSDPRAKLELAGGGRLALFNAGTKSWTIQTVDALAVVRPSDFEESSESGRKPLKRAQLLDLANRLVGIRDAEGRPVPFDYPNPDPERTSPKWIRGWRDATGTDLQGAMAEVIAQWAKDNDLTYRRADLLKRRKATDTVPGGAPDSAGFRIRKAEELAPGDQVRLPDGTVGTVERSGADVWRSDWPDAKKIEGQVLLDDGRTIAIRDLAGLPAPEPQKIGTGPNALSNAHVARTRGGSGGPAARDMMIPVKFADGADSPDAGRDPGMGSIPATSGPPGREIDFNQLVYSNYVPSIRQTYEPLPPGTRVVQNERDADSFLPADSRAKVGTALPLLADINGEVFQTVRLDDGTYDQWRVRGVRGSLGSEGAFEIDPSPERVDQIRRERGLPAIADSTPLRRDAEPEPGPPATPGEPAPEASAPEAAPAKPPKLTAPEPPPEREALPYEVIKKPNRSGKGARVRFNGREYNVDATSGVLAEVTVTDDDGHSATVAGGSSTLLRRDQFADRERALRQALTQAESQHNAESESRPAPETEPPAPEAEPLATPEPVEPESTTTIPIEQIDEAATLQDEVLGIVEQPDGTIEVTEEVAARQDRVAALIEQDDANALNLGDKSDQELTTTRDDLSEELKLQSVLATRQATPKPEILKSPAGAAEKPPQRPGLAGAAEDYSEALQSGDPEAITRTRARLESSLRRSRAGSESARALADHVTGEGDDDTETLAQLAQRMRRESREKRNTAARRRRTARRLERVRIQSLIDKVDSELQTRARTVEPEEPTSRREPRDAASIREEITRLEQEMNRVAGVDANEDNAIVNLSPNSRSRAARNAGRRRFATMDRDLARYTELRQRRDNLRSQLARTEAREVRTERETKPTISKADLANAEMIRDSRDGEWKKVRRVNATTVTVEPQFAGLDAPKIPHDRIVGVRTSADVAGRADTLAANFEEMHGTDGVREMVDRLRARKNLSAGDQALLAALEVRLTSATPSAPAALSDTEYAAHTQRVEAALNAAFTAGQTTDKVHTVNGEGAVWLPERAQAHKDIIDALWTKAANVPRDGEALIAGGLGGAGKSTVLRGGAGVDQSRFLTINPDDVKEEMVRRGLVPAVEGLSPMEASPIVHEESSHIANMLAKRAYAERVNVIWDITMSRQASVAKRIDELRAAGYDTVDAVFVDIPVETSVERALGRHRRGMESFRAGSGTGGRYVPPALIRANASNAASSANREVFDGLRGRFTSWVVFDNSVAGRDPVKVEGAGRWADTPELTNRAEPTNVVTMDEKWTGKNWRQTLRDLPVEQRRQIQDAVGTHRYKAYADARAKGEDHDAALRAATGEDENGPSLYAGGRNLEKIAADQLGVDSSLRGAGLLREMDRQKQMLKTTTYASADRQSQAIERVRVQRRISVLTPLIEQDRALLSSGREADNAFTDNPAKMSPARLRAQMFALERSQNALDQKRLAQLRRAADKRNIAPLPLDSNVSAEAAQLASNYEQMHGTAGVRDMVERLRRQVANHTISTKDQALLAALESLLGKTTTESLA
jgi:hypothetical protein